MANTGPNPPVARSTLGNSGSSSSESKSHMTRRKPRTYPQNASKTDPFPNIPNPPAHRSLTMGTLGSMKNDSPTRDRALDGITVESIMQAVLVHREFHPPGRESKRTKLVDMPKFDAITPYGITDAQEKALWKLECERLLRFSGEPDETSLFGGSGLLGKATNEAYENLSAVADQIQCNIDICLLDNELLMLEHSADLFEKNVFRRSRTRLATRFAASTEIMASANSDRLPVKLEEYNNEIYFELVDFVTGIAAKCLVRSAFGQFFANHCLAILAKWSAKLKYLTLDPIEFASTSLGEVADFITREETLATWGGLVLVNLETPFEDEFEMANVSGHKGFKLHNEDKSFRPGQDSAAGIRFSENLRASTLSGLAAHAFEITSMVYETGFRGTPTLFCQDRDEEVLASSSATIIQKSFPALGLLREVARSVKKEPGNPLQSVEAPEADADRATLTWDWNWEEPDGKMGHDCGSLAVTDMAEAISLMVPLSFTSAGVASMITTLISLSTLVTQGAELPMQYPRVSFVALFALATPAYAKHRARINKLQPDVTSVATSLLSSFNMPTFLDKRTKVDKSNQLMKSKTISTRATTESAEQQHIKQRLRALDHEINKKWTIAENSVAVDCKAYVATILLISGLLVGGGLGIGMSVGTRIHGVDPFNVTVFCWVFAGVVVLVMKSIKVENWPWKDFMYGRVVCRGVRELAANSNVSPQDIIAFLLHNEQSHVLSAKGPYHVLFTRKSNDGFAIDVKIQLDTLLGSGFVVVKVTAHTGSILVCLDIRDQFIFIR